MKLSVIGCGNMATAIVGGLIANHIFKPEDITASDKSPQAREKMTKNYGIKTLEDNAACVDTAGQGDLVLLAVKPNIFPIIAPEIKSHLDGKLILSIMAGRSIDDLEKGLGKENKIVRAMPNTPALVGAGITGYCPNSHVKEEELQKVKEVIQGFSQAEQVPENLMAVVTSVSGSSPAFIYMMIEAMADGAVAEGMPRAQAYHFAAQTVLGSAKMVLDTGKHPGELKDMVCSPAGTTIEGVNILEEKGFRTSVIQAIRAAADKARNM